MKVGKIKISNVKFQNKKIKLQTKQIGSVPLLLQNIFLVTRLQTVLFSVVHDYKQLYLQIIIQNFA